MAFNNIAYADYQGRTYKGDLKKAPQISVSVQSRNYDNGGEAPGVNATATENGKQVTTSKGLYQYIEAFRSQILLLYGAAVLLTLMAMTLSALKLAKYSDNPFLRANAVTALGVSTVVMAILGAAAWIMGIAFNFM